MKYSDLADESQAFEQLLRSPEKRVECLRLLRSQRKEYNKSIRRALSFCASFAFLAFVFWKLPTLLTLAFPSPHTADRIVTVAWPCAVLAAIVFLTRGLLIIVFRMDTDLQLNSLVLADYIDDKLEQKHKL